MAGSPAPRILYLSCDGILQPLGYSQVARPVVELTSCGWKYDLLTLERIDDRGGPAETRVASTLERAGIRWVPLTYRVGGSAAGALENLARPALEATRHARSRNIALVHARSYQGAAIARMVKLATKVPYLFDTRGFWIDERREQGRWFADDRVYRIAKAIERRLYADAAGAVSLTELGASDIAGGAFGPWRDRPIAAIPTCVDQREFTMAPRGRRRPELEAKLVVAWVGSINNWYLIDAGIQLFRHVRALRSDAHLLWLTPQVEAAEARLAAHGVEREARTVAAASHETMPEWMGSIDWGLLLLVETYAKRASMPTKLAEFLACGVRPIHFGCNTEVGDWVRRTGSGISLRSLDERAMKDAAAHIAQIGRSDVGLAEARERSAEHFSLEAGAARYDELLTRILASTSRAR